MEDYEFKVILPRKDNKGNFIKLDKHFDYAVELSKRFGGVTIIPKIYGCFAMLPDYKLKCEENVMMIANRDNQFPSRENNYEKPIPFEDDRTFIRRLSKKVGFEFGQEAILEEGDRGRKVVFVGGLKKESLSPYLLEKKETKFEDIFR